jgi:hypothetical protein
MSVTTLPMNSWSFASSMIPSLAAAGGVGYGFSRVTLSFSRA